MSVCPPPQGVLPVHPASRTGRWCKISPAQTCPWQKKAWRLVRGQRTSSDNEVAERGVTANAAAGCLSVPWPRHWKSTTPTARLRVLWTPGCPVGSFLSSSHDLVSQTRKT